MSHANEGNRFAPPRAEVAEPPLPTRPDELLLADRVLRLCAYAIDVALQLLLMALVSRFTPLDPFSSDDLLAFEPQVMALNFALFCVLQAYPIATRAQTLGKWMLGLRVVRPDGSRPSIARQLGLRYGVLSLSGVNGALALVVSLLDAVFIFRDSRRCLHDDIADTLVVKP